MIAANRIRARDTDTHLTRKSAGRPGESAAAEHVQVQVPDGLPGGLAVVDDEAEAVPVPGIRRDRAGDPEEMPAERRVVEIGERRDVRAGHDEHMQRRLRVDVSERDGAVVLMDDLRGDLARDDAADHAIAHTS